jgi:hypothetical protein
MYHFISLAETRSHRWFPSDTPTVFLWPALHERVHKSACTRAKHAGDADVTATLQDSLAKCQLRQIGDVSVERNFGIGAAVGVNEQETGQAARGFLEIECGRYNHARQRPDVDRKS